MKLGDYLEKHDLTRAEFAAKVGVTHAAIVRYINGKRRPEWPIMDRISQITEGVVTPDDFAGADTRLSGGADKAA